MIKWFQLGQFHRRNSIREGGVINIKKKVSLRLETKLLNALIQIYETDSISEAVNKAIVEIVTEGKSKKKLKTLFPYVGKKPPRIAREVVEAFQQSGCKVFVDLFCGSLAILCYLPEDTKIVVNDINADLTNLYVIIKTKLVEFIAELEALPYSEVLFQKYKEVLGSDYKASDLERAVAYYYVQFASFRGRSKNASFRISADVDNNMVSTFRKNLPSIIALSDRLQTVEILNRDFRKVMNQFSDASVFVYADCPYLGTEDYYECEVNSEVYVFGDNEHKDLAQMLKEHKGNFALSSKAKKDLRKLYRSNGHYVLDFEATGRMPDKRHREQLIMNFKMKHVNKYGEEDIKPYR
ncbi:MAG: DNA adenine methylase [Anaerocolumna sp.]